MLQELFPFLWKLSANYILETKYRRTLKHYIYFIYEQ